MATTKTQSPNGMHVTNGLSDVSTTQIQVVDEQKHFTSNLRKQIDLWGLGDAGFDYNIVSVFGSQATGKSTLLNRLFGTTFDVMDESRRQQTTKGIWMCRSKSKNIIVMDVEGTDGRERGEDQDFERKAALFSLASSEVLIVNMWEHQVGLYQGANLGLLKTVLEVNLSLFGKKAQDGTQSRTLLLFVIRDHSTTPLSNLQSTLTDDLNKIWDTIAKPSDLSHAKLSNYFDLAFTALPHKRLAASEFESEVANLRIRFVDPQNEDHVFKPQYHKRIPADGVAFYMESIWEQVQANKDLDLPTQQELLAQFRCDEISAVALSEFNEQARSQKRPIEAGRVVDGLGKLMRGWREVALSRYDREASRYHQGVYKRKRTDLLASLDSILSSLFLGQLKNIHKFCLGEFKLALADGLKGDRYNFAEVVNLARARSEGKFEECAKEAVVVEGDEGQGMWAWKEEMELLREEIGNVADLFRKDETKKMVNLVERKFKKQIADPVQLYLNKGEQHMWDDVLKLLKAKLEGAEKTYLSKAQSFNCTQEENDHFLATLRKRAWLALRSKIDEQTADSAILAKLRAHFEDRFRYDDQGVPRVWKPDDDIDGAFKVAKDQTLELIPLYAKMSPLDPFNEYVLPMDSRNALNNDTTPDEEIDFEASLVVFTETKSLELANRFRKDADAYYVEAKRSTVATMAQIPYWIYIALVVLGWNEAMAIMFNPFYFALTVVALCTAYIIVQLKLVGPLYHVMFTIYKEIERQATERLREHFTQPILEQTLVEEKRIKTEPM